MDVDNTEVPSTSHGSGAGTAVRPKDKGTGASHAQTRPTGPRQCVGQKAKQHATDQQGVRAMVADVLERQGMERKDWEQSHGPDYRVEPLKPPTWVVYPSPGQHLATLQGVSVDEWLAELDITPDELLRWLVTMAQGSSQACSYRSQELYFQIIQVVKETMRRYEEEQGLQYRENPIHLDRALVRPILATFDYHQRELRAAREQRQAARDREVDANVHCMEAEHQVAQLKRDLLKSQDTVREAQRP